MTNFEEVLEYQKREGTMPFAGVFGVVLDHEDNEQMTVIKKANKGKRELTDNEIEQFMERVINE